MKEIIPVNIDLYAMLIFMGIVQGFFLSFFFFSPANRKLKANKFLGAFIIACSLLSIDIFLCHTNLMFRVIHLNDSSEFIVLLLGPLFYLYIVHLIGERNVKRYWLHFIPAALYLIYSVFYFVQTGDYKYNSYVSEFHPELPFIHAPEVVNEDPLGIKRIVTQLGMTSYVVYIVLSGYELVKGYAKRNDMKDKKGFLKFLFKNFGGVVLVLFTWVIVKQIYPHGEGEFIITVSVAGFLYYFTFEIISDSAYFRKPLFEEKYKKSGLDDTQRKDLVNRIVKFIEDEKYYLKQNATLANLAKELGTIPNYISQAINQEMGVSFNELLAKYRVEAAKLLLVDKDNPYTIEEIAYKVGYNSKTSFNTAFKRNTGLTPSAFRNEN